MYVSIKTPTREELLELCRNDPDTVINFIELLISTSTSLEERIRVLETQLKQDSHNSHKPPSSDGLKRIIKAQRNESKRPSGAQEGHKGKTLNMVTTPDRIIDHRVPACETCGCSLRTVKPDTIHRRQVFDIPEPHLEVTEHRCEVKQCPRCGTRTTAPFPPSVTKAAQYGTRLKSFCVYVMQQHLVPFKRTTELLHDLFACDIAEGSLYRWNAEAYQLLEQSEQAIKEHLIQAPVVHADETGIFCEHRLHWLHVTSTSSLTHYALHRKRGAEATQAIDILPHVRGRIIHDFWEPYLRYDCKHGFCNSHIVRELTSIAEQGNQQWANDLIKHLYHIHTKVMKDKAASNNALHPITLSRYQQQYDAIVQRGLRINLRNRSSPHTRGRTKQSKARNLLERLRDHRTEVLAFMYDFAVPFTNNIAESDLRMAKVKQKISGTFRSRPGGDFFCRIRGYISTARKNGQHVFDTLLNAFLGNPFIPACNYAE